MSALISRPKIRTCWPPCRSKDLLSGHTQRSVRAPTTSETNTEAADGVTVQAGDIRENAVCRSRQMEHVPRGGKRTARGAIVRRSIEASEDLNGKMLSISSTRRVTSLKNFVHDAHRANDFNTVT